MYVLGIKLNVNGKKINQKLAELDLEALEKYTSYCNSSFELIDIIKRKYPEIGNFLEIHHTGSDSIFIKTSLSNRAKEIPVLYKKDLDVLLSNEADLLKILKEKYSISVSDVLNNNIDENVKKVLKQLVSKRSKPLKDRIFEARNSMLNLDGYYDKRYEKITELWQVLGLFEKNLEFAVNELCKDYRGKQELALIIKENQDTSLFDMGKTRLVKDFELGTKTITEKDSRLIELNLKLDREKKNYSEILNQISDNLHYIKLKPVKEEKKVDSKPITDDFLLDSYRKLLQSENNQYEKRKIEELINLLQTRKQLFKQLTTAKRQEKEIIENEIKKINYEVYCLENGEVNFTDGGFIDYGFGNK